MGKKLQESYRKLALAVAENPPTCSEPEYQELFFPDFKDFGRPLSELQRRMIRNEAEAKIICNFCPVRQLCADYAILAEEPFGVWGGTTPAERKAISSFSKSNKPGHSTAK
jgi:hypothetical protein